MNKIKLICLLTLVLTRNLFSGAFYGTNAGQNAIAHSSVGFEENKGQFTDEFGKPVEDILFRFRTSKADVYITQTGLSYVFFKTTHKHEPGHKNDNDSIYFARVDMVLKGATISKDNMVKELPLETEVNYYNQYNPNGILHVKQYRKIVLRNVYKGIDWVWYISNSKGVEQMKYDFIVHPNADPAQIKML